MFRHRGKSRTLAHNLKLASLLSFVAGIVNVAGLFAIQKLTTNVTGHFAFSADEFVERNFQQAFIYLFYILAFLLGAFCSGLLLEVMWRRNSRYRNTLPVAIEIALLAGVGLLGPKTVAAQANSIACVLLFAMGLQNALVTQISNSVVRTTHLTGLFTDLGIEFSQLIFYKQPQQQQKLRASVKLRITIICFFFLGGIAGGLGYIFGGIKVLLLAAAVLAIALVFDTVKIRVLRLKRRIT